MNTQRLTLATIIVAVLVIAGFLIVPRLSSTGGSGAAAELDLSKQPSLGSDDAPVKIVLFEDFRCPHCRDFTADVYPRLKHEYVDTGKAEIFYVNFPVLGPQSEEVALVGECVYQQSNSAFWELKEALFRSQAELENSRRVLELAKTYAPGIDADKLQACFEKGDLRSNVRQDDEIAKSLGLRGTPSVLVNGRQVANPSLAGVQQAVESALSDSQ